MWIENKTGKLFLVLMQIIDVEEKVITYYLLIVNFIY